MKYQDLSIRDKVAVIKAAVRGGITNLQEIESNWNSFDEGGQYQTAYDDTEPRNRQAFAESRFNNDAVSKANAIGLFQIQPITLQEYNDKNGTSYTEQDLRNSEVSARIRDWYMDSLSKREFATKGGASDSITAAKAYAAYNMGPQKLVRYLNDAKAKGIDIYGNGEDKWGWLKELPKETEDYVNFILRGKNVGPVKNDFVYGIFNNIIRPNSVPAEKHSTGGPQYPFSFVKGVLPEVRYDDGGQEYIDFGISNEVLPTINTRESYYPQITSEIPLTPEQIIRLQEESRLKDVLESQGTLSPEYNNNYYASQKHYTENTSKEKKEIDKENKQLKDKENLEKSLGVLSLTLPSTITDLGLMSQSKDPYFKNNPNAALALDLALPIGLGAGSKLMSSLKNPITKSFNRKLVNEWWERAPIAGDEVLIDKSHSFFGRVPTNEEKMLQEIIPKEYEDFIYRLKQRPDGDLILFKDQMPYIQTTYIPSDEWLGGVTRHNGKGYPTIELTLDSPESALHEYPHAWYDLYHKRIHPETVQSMSDEPASLHTLLEYAFNNSNPKLANSVKGIGISNSVGDQIHKTFKFSNEFIEEFLKHQSQRLNVGLNLEGEAMAEMGNFRGKLIKETGKTKQELDKVIDALTPEKIDNMMQSSSSYTRDWARQEHTPEYYNNIKTLMKMAGIATPIVGALPNTDNIIQTNSSYENGGGIHIKPENRGKFTALKERTGHSATWFKENGTPAQRKMATFALNARKWKHDDGGYIYDNQHLMTPYWSWQASKPEGDWYIPSVQLPNGKYAKFNTKPTPGMNFIVSDWELNGQKNFEAKDIKDVSRLKKSSLKRRLKEFHTMNPDIPQAIISIDGNGKPYFMSDDDFLNQYTFDYIGSDNSNPEIKKQEAGMKAIKQWGLYDKIKQVADQYDLPVDFLLNRVINEGALNKTIDYYNNLSTAEQQKELNRNIYQRLDYNTNYGGYGLDSFAEQYEKGLYNTRDKKIEERIAKNIENYNTTDVNEKNLPVTIFDMTFEEGLHGLAADLEYRYNLMKEKFPNKTDEELYNLATESFAKGINHKDIRDGKASYKVPHLTELYYTEHKKE